LNLLVLPEKTLRKNPHAQKVLFRDLEAFNLHTLIDTNAQVHLGGPFVLGVDIDVLGSIGLGNRKHVGVPNEPISPEKPFGLFQEKGIQALTDREEEFIQDKLFPGANVDLVG